jgi:hypothetical protein
LGPSFSASISWPTAKSKDERPALNRGLRRANFRAFEALELVYWKEDYTSFSDLTQPPAQW